MIDFDIKDFQLNKNYSISASAGTGKTFNMVEIVDKLLSNKIDISNILIVTYTEKAAGELKSRIAQKFKGKGINIDMSKAHIGTIHSFCKETISEFYITMGLPSSLNVVDDSKMDDLYDEFIRELLYNNEFSIDDSKINYIKDIVKYLYLDKNGNIDENIVSFKLCNDDYFYFDLNNKLKEFKNKTNDEIESFFKNCDSNCIEQFKDEYKKLKDAFLCLYTDEYSKSSELKENIIDNVKIKGKFGYNGNKFRLKSYPKFEIFTKIKNENADEVCKYKDHAIELYKRWQEEKKRNKWMSFNDMLREVREGVLSKRELVDKLRKKYKYALIDEFQDTNQLQWDIFKEVFLKSSDNHIIVVGDRKQSIYSFQGADLTVYDRAVKSIIDNGGIECNLPKNYRSSKSMIEGYNRLFKMPSFNSLDYSDVLVGKDDIVANYEGKEIKGIGIVVSKKDDTEGIVTPFEYAKKCVELIVDYCTKDENGRTKLILDKNSNVTFKDFMVLARNRSELSSFEYELRRVGIPFVKYKDDKLFKGIECRQWVAIINAILKPDFTGKNRRAFRKALHTKFFGLSLKEASSIDFDRDDSKEMELILKWKNLFLKQDYNELVDSIITDSRLEEVLGSITEIQTLNVFRQIGDYCLNYLLEGNSLYLLKNNLINLSRGNADNDDEGGSIVAKGTDFDCVELMTMHASKGLDRAVVFVVGGEKKDNKKASPIGIYHENDNGVTRTYITAKKDLYTNEKNAEKDRLFYVAYTRAKNLMILPYYKANSDVKVIDSIGEYLKDDNDLFTKIEYEEDKCVAVPVLKKRVQEIIDSNTSSEGKESQLALLKSISNKMHLHNTYKHSYASMSKLKDEVNVFDGRLNANKEGSELEEALEGIDYCAIPANLEYRDITPSVIPQGFPKGAAVGTTLHEIFEEFEFSDINSDNNLEEIITDRFKANSLSCCDEYKEYVLNMVNNVLKAKLPIINGSNIDTNNYFMLNSLKKEDRLAEAEFNFSELIDSGYSNYCNGFIDLLFKRGDYYSILDWKSDTINNSDLLSYNNLSDIKKRVDGHYSIQRVLYSYTLVNWLYDLGLESTKEEVFNKHFGGIYYVFIRGCIKDTYNGIYAQSWESWSDLETEFNKIIKMCKNGGLKR